LILDTTAVIDLLKNRKDIKEKLKELEGKNVVFTTTTITNFEMWAGPMDLKEEQELNEFFKTIRIYPLTEKDAEIAGKVHKVLRKEGQEIGSEDCMIAGIAIAKQEPVLTRNKKHFERIPELVVYSY